MEMTFKEYLNQKDPQRRHGVKVTTEDCEGIWCNHTRDTAVVSLKILDGYHTYVTKPGSNILWVPDEDGNPRSISCFTLTEEAKPIKKWNKKSRQRLATSSRKD